MNPSRVVTTFVAADGLCEILSSTGVGQIVNYDNPLKVKIGGGLIKVSLFVSVTRPHRGVLTRSNYYRNSCTGIIIGWPAPPNCVILRIRRRRYTIPP